ncbi:unnamed protein product [Paramecium sonneborni]|uniref:Uncharacterized protein n=1 Tax=Paramecium sonneborni TaxID=65129 RepID=A0A8S1RL70_9CILI|nr:unnamed protein product [Paramecium sonneborni]
MYLQYQNYWLNSNQEFLTCPFCKNSRSKSSLIYLYSKDETITNKPLILTFLQDLNHVKISIANGVTIAEYGLVYASKNI